MLFSIYTKGNKKKKRKEQEICYDDSGQVTECWKQEIEKAK